MKNQDDSKISVPYFLVVFVLMLVLPLLSMIAESCIDKPLILSYLSLIGLTGKWFLFWSVGVRLCAAGFKQAINPSFTAKNIFHIENDESLIIVRELGFANICLGSIGIVSLYVPGWRMAAAFAGGVFFGIAGIAHLIKKPVSANEWLAMVSDLFIFLVMLAYLVSTL